jgi:MoxR-like ATPase
MTTGKEIIVTPIIKPEKILQARNLIHEIYVDEKIKDYVVDLVFATRTPADYNLNDITDLIEYGASPRATIYLILAAKAHAFLKNRGYVIPDDIKAIAMDVLRHRVIVTYEAEAEEIQSEELVQRILDEIEVP